MKPGKGRHMELASRQGEASSPLVVAQHPHNLPFRDRQYPSNGIDGLLLPLLQLLLAVHDVGSLAGHSPGSASVLGSPNAGDSAEVQTQLLISRSVLGITFFAVVSTSACESKSKSSSSEPPPYDSSALLQP